MKLTVKRFQNAPFSENGYVAINESDECVIIDPGGSYDDVLAYIKDRHCQPIAILLTHGHCDHVAGVGPLHENLQIPVYLHERDVVRMSFSLGTLFLPILLAAQIWWVVTGWN